MKMTDEIDQHGVAVAEIYHHQGNGWKGARQLSRISCCMGTTSTIHAPYKQAWQAGCQPCRGSTNPMMAVSIDDILHAVGWQIEMAGYV